jgi:hypothetical protein
MLLFFSFFFQTQEPDVAFFRICFETQEPDVAFLKKKQIQTQELNQGPQHPARPQPRGPCCARHPLLIRHLDRSES